MGFPKLFIEGRARSIVELHMNVQKELVGVNQKLHIAITRITNTCGHLDILATSIAEQFKNILTSKRIQMHIDKKEIARVEWITEDRVLQTIQSKIDYCSCECEPPNEHVTK
ncbi:hypothetical protein BT93_L1847 [Corymbia citriodora subsp. variegata]|uniref:Uncharacterized protein n=1 Tax=Corymbia citriodora subsp. variegata TaxID=360336 RepID=A0A8T0CLG0_CORYI|nr:hypothetical protein BT93_L1847 [Corymbia citriodora subsp. variegata]